jgi:RecA/RadA recombinase
MQSDVSMREVCISNVPLQEALAGTPWSSRVAMLQSKGIQTALDAVVKSEKLRTALSAEDMRGVLLACSQRFAPSHQSVLQAWSAPRVSWRCDALDAVWGGGVQLTGVTELAGSAGTAKTQCALWLAGSVLQQHGEAGVVFVCTEGNFPSKRYAQLCEDVPDAQSRTVIERAASMDELWTLLQQRLPILLVRCKAKLVVIDSIGALRGDYEASETGARSEMLWQIGQYLKWVNERYDCGVIVTNQVRALMTENAPPHLSAFRSAEEQVTPALGLVWSNVVNTRIMLSKSAHSVDINGTEQVVRNMTITLCPYLPNVTIPFAVTTNAIRGLIEGEEGE